MAIIWDKVTPYSKFAAVIFFLFILPVWIFYIATQYKHAVKDSVVSTENQTTTPVEAQDYSGIVGRVTITPTCPVARENDDSCRDMPYSAYLKIWDSNGKLVTETLSAKDGTFIVFLQSGSYTINKGDEKVLPSLIPQTVEVKENELISVNLQFDSGIR